MRTAVVTAAVFALSLAIPAFVPVQSHSQDRSITIPLPGFGGSNNRAQQAQLPDRDRYCSDLRNRADDLRYRRDNARFRDEAMQAGDQLRDVNDQLRRDCNR